jgi:hypothetical protein
MAKVSLASMTREEKLNLMEELWADLTADPDSFESPAWHAGELEATKKRVEAGEEKPVDWEIAKQQILAKLK